MKPQGMLKPLKYLDEQTLRLYTQFVRKFEKKGKSRYSICAALDVASLIGVSILLPNSRPPFFGVVYGATVWGPNVSRGIDEARARKNIQNEVATEIDYTEFGALGKASSRYLRLPILLSSLGFGGKAVLEAYNGIVNKDSSQLSSALSDAVGAFGLFSLSSSMYMKDADPNILKKEPFWKSVYNWAKKKVESLTPVPTPVPQPIPVVFNSIGGLEEKV